MAGRFFIPYLPTSGGVVSSFKLYFLNSCFIFSSNWIEVPFFRLWLVWYHATTLSNIGRLLPQVHYCHLFFNYKNVSMKKAQKNALLLVAVGAAVWYFWKPISTWFNTMKAKLSGTPGTGG